MRPPPPLGARLRKRARLRCVAPRLGGPFLRWPRATPGAYAPGSQDGGDASDSRQAGNGLRKDLRRPAASRKIHGYIPRRLQIRSAVLARDAHSPAEMMSTPSVESRPVCRRATRWTLLGILLLGGVAVLSVAVFMTRHGRGARGGAVAEGQPGSAVAAEGQGGNDATAVPEDLRSPAEVLGLSPEVPTTVEGLNQEAFTTCDRLVADLPHRPEAHAVAAFIYNRHGRNAEAARCWQKSLEVNPKFAAGYNGLGIVAAAQGENAKAVEYLRKAVELDPSLGRAHSLLVEVLLREAKAEEARRAAEEYVKHVPDSGDSHYWLGQALWELGKLAEAKNRHLEAVRIDPKYTPAYYSLAVVCARLGQRDEAKQYREKFAAMKEKELEDERKKSRGYTDLEAQVQLAASYHLAAGNVHLAFGDPRKAEAHWRRGAAIATKSTACREALLDYYERRNRIGSALGQLDELLAIEPANATYWIRRGRLHARISDVEGAEAAFRKAVELAPDSPDGYLSLVEFFLQSRRKIAETPALAEKAVQHGPSVLAYMLLSAAREENQDRAGALAAVEQALKLDPDNPQLRKFREQLQKSAIRKSPQ